MWSGPAKGYTEALEHRLRETETALLRLWHASSSGTVERAFAGDVGSNDRRTTPIVGNHDSGSAKAGLITHWEEYPLESAGDIQRWAADVVGRERTEGFGTPELRGTTPLHGQPPPISRCAVQPSPTPASRPTASGTDANDHLDRESGETLIRLEPSSGLQEGTCTGENVQAANMGSHTVHGRFEMSEEFRRQFLW